MVVGSASGVPAAVSGQRSRNQPEGVQPLPSVQRQGCRSWTEGAARHGITFVPVCSGSHQTQLGTENTIAVFAVHWMVHVYAFVWTGGFSGWRRRTAGASSSYWRHTGSSTESRYLLLAARWDIHVYVNLIIVFIHFQMPSFVALDDIGEAYKLDQGPRADHATGIHLEGSGQRSVGPGAGFSELDVQWYFP